MSQKVIEFLVIKKSLPKLKDISLQPYSDCLVRKQHKVEFKSKPASQKANVLHLVHSNICGPIKEKTLGGSLYFITFIDNCSRKVWVYTLKTKNQALFIFNN